MKKICHVTSAHPAFDGRIYRRACVSCVGAGYETYLVQRGESGISEGVHIVGLGEPEKPGRLYRGIIFARKAYRKALEVDADLYQLHDPELLPFAMKLKRKGKKVVFDSHENYPDQFRTKPYLPHWVSVLLSEAFRIYTHRLYPRIDGITYPTEDEYYEILKTINKGISISNNVPWLSEMYDKYDPEVKPEPNTVCYAGGIGRERGAEQMIKAAYRANCKMYLAGRFTSSEYQKEIESLEEYSCVTYLGQLERDEVFRLYQKSSVGLSLLLDVGQYYKGTNLPTKVYEYMSMGIPVISNDSPYNKQVIPEIGVGYCVNPMNIDSVAKAIRELLDDENKRNQLGANGRKAIKEKYNWDLEQNNLLNVYEDIFRE